MKISEWIPPSLFREFVAQQIDAHRLATFVDGWVERFGNEILISYKSDVARERLVTELDLWSQQNALPAGRVFARFLPKKNAERVAPHLISGDADQNLRTSVAERSLRFEINFGAGYSVGLFIDQRENRHHLREIKPKKLLNCFAYTCSFSVAAASVGAQTVNIDLSKKSLARGRENFSLNALAAGDDRFIADDVMLVLPRLARRGEKFDTIILDPPTFSRSHRGKTFHAEQDYEPLLLAALEVAERDAHILVSTNCSTLHERALEVMARFCLKATHRAGEFQHAAPLPDFPTGEGASTLWLKLR